MDWCMALCPINLNMTRLLNMPKVYVGQTALQLRLSIEQDITDVYNRILIRFKRPNGTMGYWEAEVLDSTRGIIAFNMNSNAPTFNDTGWWTIWAYIFFKDGSASIGDAIRIEVFEEGEGYIAYPYGQLSSIGEGEVQS